MSIFFLGLSLLLLTITSIAEGTFRKNNSRNIEDIRFILEYHGWQFDNCYLPPHPENGQWEVISGVGTPGSAIFPNTLIKFSCNSGFELEPQVKFFICDRDWDTSKMPRCIERLCPPLKSSTVKSVRCFNGQGNPVDCSKVPNGGTAVTKCAPYYELSKEEDSTIQCVNENWSSHLPECNISCGKEVNVRELQVTHENQQFPKYPWIATIFKEEKGQMWPRCHASLISESHVITAAHCVVELSADGTLNYKVSAGKTYQDYGDPRDLMAQYVDVTKFIIHPNFSMFRKGDIAVVKTKHPFRLSPLVQPICIRGLPETAPSDDDRGIVSLWGFGSDGKFTKEVKYYERDLNQTECMKNGKFPLTAYMADKLCVHFIKGDDICNGDSGAGFAVKNTKNNRFFIQGFISFSSVSNGCRETPNICTKTLAYYDFILEAMEAL